MIRINLIGARARYVRSRITYGQMRPRAAVDSFVQVWNRPAARAYRKFQHARVQRLVKALHVAAAAREQKIFQDPVVRRALATLRGPVLASLRGQGKYGGRGAFKGRGRGWRKFLPKLRILPSRQK